MKASNILHFWKLAGVALVLSILFLSTQSGISSGQGIPTPTPSNWNSYDDNDPNLLFEGQWWTFEVADAQGGSLTATEQPDATLSVYFEGPGIRVIYSKGPEGGPFHARVDGQWIQIADNYAPDYSYGHILAFEDLEASQVWPSLQPGQHELVATAQDAPLWIEAVEVQGRLLSPPSDRPPAWRTYQDTSPLVRYYNGAWQTFPVTGASGRTVTGTADYEAALAVRFEGTAVRVIFSIGPEGSILVGQVDRYPSQAANAHSTDYGYSFDHSLDFDYLSSGSHVLVVANGMGATWIDAIEVRGTLLPYGDTPLPPVTFWAISDSSSPPDEGEMTASGETDVEPAGGTYHLVVMPDGRLVLDDGTAQIQPGGSVPATPEPNPDEPPPPFYIDWSSSEAGIFRNGYLLPYPEPNSFYSLADYSRGVQQGFTPGKLESFNLCVHVEPLRGKSDPSYCDPLPGSTATSDPNCRNLAYLEGTDFLPYMQLFVDGELISGGRLGAENSGEQFREPESHTMCYRIPLESGTHSVRYVFEYPPENIHDIVDWSFTLTP